MNDINPVAEDDADPSASSATAAVREESSFFRRLRRDAARHNWFAVGIDLAILVLGVFLGLQVNNWNQARLERGQAHEDRNRLAADMAANVVDYQNRGRYYSAVRQHAQAALDALAKSADASGGDFLIDAYEASQIVPREAKHVTYDEVLAAGRLTHLGPPDLRDVVANYYLGLRTTGQILGNVPPYREHVRQAMPSDIQARVRTRCPEHFEFLSDGTVLATLAARCTLAAEPASIRRAVAAIRARHDLPSDLSRLIDDLDGKIELLGPLIAHARLARAAVLTADDD